MLQIKKNSKLIFTKYNLIFLFRRKSKKNSYMVKKQKTSTILLRAPKHFNIGKQKILSLNYKMPNLRLPSDTPISLNTFLTKKDIVFSILLRRAKLTPVTVIGSIRLTIKTKFQITWLEI